MATPYKSVSETADMLGVTTGRVRQFLLDGRLKGEKIGNQWAIHVQEISRFSAIERESGNPNLKKSESTA